LNDYLQFAKTAGLNNKQIENSITNFKEKLKEVFPLIDSSFLDKKLKEKYKTLIDTRANLFNLTD
jgi:hypothetical protein